MQEWPDHYDVDEFGQVNFGPPIPPDPPPEPEPSGPVTGMLKIAFIMVLYYATFVAMAWLALR